MIEMNYPIPVFYYGVTIEGTNDILAFSEVSGLSIEYETITYKHGLSWKQGAIHMPGMGTPVNLSLKQGVIHNNDYFYKWINSIGLGTVEKRDITISLLTEGDPPAPKVSWKVTKAFPTNLDSPTFDATSNEVAIESLDLMADGLTIEHH